VLSFGIGVEIVGRTVQPFHQTEWTFPFFAYRSLLGQLHCRPIWSLFYIWYYWCAA